MEKKDLAGTQVLHSGFAAVVGRPNVGKSTLLNCLAGGKASIVSHKRQTTRSIVRAVTTSAAARIVWLDTPGWQTTMRGGINRALNAAAERAVAAADCVVFVAAAGVWTAGDEKFLARIDENFGGNADDNGGENVGDNAGEKKPVLCAVNKIDLISDKNLLLPFIENIAKKRDFAAFIPLSAKTGDGVEALQFETGKLLPKSAALLADGDGNEAGGERGFLFAELLREKLFLYLGEELPYKAGVVADAPFVEKGAVRVAAEIFVEKESQKNIVIGKGGAMLKKIATAARRDMERVAGRKVFLTTRVKAADWTRDAKLLRRMRIGGGL